MDVRSLFGHRHPLIGMVHLRPLPGSPRWDGDWKAVEDLARHEAGILADTGADGIVVENFGDVPFHPKRVEPVTVAAMTRLVQAVREETRGERPLGVNVLRNDATAAISVAMVAGAQFIRVNVHTGTKATDQGVIEGDAANTLRERARLRADVLIFADVRVKHAAPLGADTPIEDEAADTFERGLADALILSGTATGAPAAMAHLSAVRTRLPEAPLFVGSGASLDTLDDLLGVADGVIVGTALKHDGVPSNSIDPERAQAFFRHRPER